MTKPFRQGGLLKVQGLWDQLSSHDRGKAAQQGHDTGKVETIAQQGIPGLGSLILRPPDCVGGRHWHTQQLGPLVWG